MWARRLPWNCTCYDILPDLVKPRRNGAGQVSDQVPSPMSKPVLSTSREPHRPLVLVVEDDPVDQEMIVLAFKRASVDNRIVTMPNGEEALEYLMAGAEFQWRRISDLPAVIILDLAMPKMNGFEFLRRVKAEPRISAIPVVVLTTSQFDRDLAQSYELGASSCLTKPGNFEQLVKLVAEVDLLWCRDREGPGRS
jgi:two-component system, response regulator